MNTLVTIFLAFVELRLELIDKGKPFVNKKIIPYFVDIIAALS
jgi:hypothetical protein